MLENGVPAAASSPQQVARLMDGYLSTQLLYVAAKLCIAEALTDGPRDAEALAGAVNAQPDPLRRVLRGLTAEGVLNECPDGRFGLTELGMCLCSDAPGSLRGAIIARGDVYYGAAAGLLESVQHGGVAFERVHGLGFFEYLTQHPELGAEFQGSMADRSRQEAADVVAGYDFECFQQVIDVGGGHGFLLEAILRAAPRSRGVLVDQPPVVERARKRLGATGLARRCTFIPGDFFSAVPPGGDAYVLSRDPRLGRRRRRLYLDQLPRSHEGLRHPAARRSNSAGAGPGAARADPLGLAHAHPPAWARADCGGVRAVAPGGRVPARAHRADAVACRGQCYRGGAGGAAGARWLRLWGGKTSVVLVQVGVRLQIEGGE